MIQIILSCVFLYFLIEKMSGDVSPVKGQRVVAIVVAALAIQIGLGLLSKQLLWQLVSLCIPGLVVWLALDVWCRIGHGSALKIAALYTAVNIALTIAISFLFLALART